MTVTTKEKILPPISFGDEARDQWIAALLKELPNNARLLDAGAGEQKYRKYCSHLDYVSQDFAQYDGKGDGLGIQKGSWDTKDIDIVSDITNIPEENNSFDAILCIAVIEHIPDPMAAFCEFSRLLKPGGKLIISAPFASTTHFAPFHFYSGFTRYFYSKHLPDSGFEITSITPNGNFFDFVKALVHNLPDFFVNFSQKKLLNDDLETFAKLSNLLDSASKLSDHSEELLNFGYNVVAINGRE